MIARLWRRVWRRRWIRVCSGMGRSSRGDVDELSEWNGGMWDFACASASLMRWALKLLTVTISQVPLRNEVGECGGLIKICYGSPRATPSETKLQLHLLVSMIPTVISTSFLSLNLTSFVSACCPYEQSASLRILFLLQQSKSPSVPPLLLPQTPQQMGVHLHVANVGELPTIHRPGHWATQVARAML